MQKSETLFEGQGLTVFQSGERRVLSSADGLVQSEIDLAHPGELPNPVSRAMLAHLLFRPPPESVLLAGCGGGAVARWLHARSPRTRGVAVEISPTVVDLARRWFDFPPRQSNWRLQRGDVQDYLAGADSGKLDFILMDIAEQGSSPDWLAEREFLRNCRSSLSEQGVLTLNLIPRDAAHLACLLWALRQVFFRQVLCFSLSGRGNVMALAFNRAPQTDNLGQAARAASALWGLSFDDYLQRMRRENPPGSGIF